MPSSLLLDLAQLLLLEEVLEVPLQGYTWWWPQAREETHFDKDMIP